MMIIFFMMNVDDIDTTWQPAAVMSKCCLTVPTFSVLILQSYSLKRHSFVYLYFGQINVVDDDDDDNDWSVCHEEQSLTNRESVWWCDWCRPIYLIQRLTSLKSKDE